VLSTGVVLPFDFCFVTTWWLAEKRTLLADGGGTQGSNFFGEGQRTNLRKLPYVIIIIIIIIIDFNPRDLYYRG